MKFCVFLAASVRLVDLGTSELCLIHILKFNLVYLMIIISRIT